MSPEREAELRREFAYDGLGRVTPPEQIEESIRRIKAAEESDAG